MQEHIQERKVTCPYDGWQRTIQIVANEDERLSVVVAGVGEVIKDIRNKLTAAITDEELLEANAWIDMPRCPSCNKVYQYNVRTGATRK